MKICIVILVLRPNGLVYIGAEIELCHCHCSSLDTVLSEISTAAVYISQYWFTMLSPIAVCVVCLSALTCAADRPAASCLPKQWEAVAIGELVQAVSPIGDVDLMALKYELSYDFKHKMDSTRQVIELGNSTVRVTAVNDWNKVGFPTQHKHLNSCII